MGFAEVIRKVAYRTLIATARDVTAGTSLRSMLVVAPHPDDETLGCGARIILSRRQGSRVKLLVATDGAGSQHRASQAGLS